MNALDLHGAVTAKKHAHYFIHQDNKPFFWLADTWWYGATKRMPFFVFKQIVNLRKKQGFSVIQLVIGVPPEIGIYDSNTQGEGGLPFDKDKSLNNVYFDKLDKKIAYLVEKGLVPCIVGGWGWHMDVLGKSAIMNLWQEIIIRFAKYPVVFCLTGEVDGPAPVSPLLKKILRLLPGKARLAIYKLRKSALNRRIEQWNQVAGYIKKNDKYKRLLTVHTSSYKNAKSILGKDVLLDFDTIQSGHSNEGYKHMIDQIYRRREKSLPIINMEPWYEGILGNFEAFYQRLAFWVSILGGAAGHSYGAHGLWQMAGKKDNFMKHWGDSYWREAVMYPGAEQIGNAKRFLEKMEWWNIKTDPTALFYETDIFSATIGNLIIGYIPRVSEEKLGINSLKKANRYSVSFFDPETMREIGRRVVSSKKIELPHNAMGKDLLVIFRQLHGIIV